MPACFLNNSVQHCDTVVGLINIKINTGVIVEGLCRGDVAQFLCEKDLINLQ